MSRTERDISQSTALKAGQNLVCIRTNSEPKMSRGALATLIGTSHQTITSWETNQTIPPVDRILYLREQLPNDHVFKNFSITDFYENELWNVGTEDEEGGAVTDTYNNVCGNFLVYFFDTAKTNSTPTKALARPLRYMVLSISPTAGGYPHVEAVPFKEFDEALNLLRKMNKREGDLLFGNQAPRNRYEGSIHALKENFFAVAMENPVGDYVTVYLKRPLDRDSEYIGGLGLMCSISRGAKSCPVAQEVIVAHGPIERSEEQIAKLLYVDFPLPDLELQLRDEIASHRKVCEGLGDAFDTEYTDIILVQRIKKLYENAIAQIAMSHLRLDAVNEEYGNIYHLLKNYTSK